ncbi:endoplasmic reticulum membrane protein [Ceratobasidium sp. AG-Ba]|nr:endoplasmic reticulum membrane protein [Ceratobasidium sp. AG-Ba]QRW10298.1 endoplasmic reticulum membrane protein [Ceratobasidium sp. AG-Ba]
MQLLQRKELEWTRDMAITNIKFASMLVDFAEHKIVSESGASEYSGFGERLVAYMAAAQLIVLYSKGSSTKLYPAIPLSARPRYWTR